MTGEKFIYFVSDAHLGTPDAASSLIREKLLVEFLETITPNAAEIFILGDLFDFWFEYKRVVPRGFTRLFGALTKLTDQGIPVHLFTGNHDLWIFDYLPTETGVILHRSNFEMERGGKRFILAHGDDFNEQDRRYRFIKSIFTNRMLQWAFARLHPNFAIWIADAWSRRSRQVHGEDPFKGEEEPMVQYIRSHLSASQPDYIVCGHRHTPVNYALNSQSRLVILGDWLRHFTYAVFDGKELELKGYKETAEGR